MKTNIIRYTVVVFAATALAMGCSMFGANPKPPSAFESKLFDITTNATPQVMNVTNVITQTNVVTVPSPVGVLVNVTNLVTTTNVVQQTNEVASYTLAPKPAITAGIQTIASTSGPFTAGIGTMVGAALLALYGGWAQLRSNKLGNTSSALAQEIETIRQFILTLPSGTKIDQAVTQFMQQHQVEAGVATTVLGILAKDVSNNDAKAAATTLQEAIGILSSPPAAPKT